MENRQTVLIVDDIADNLNIVADLLIRENINVLLAQSGKEALATTTKLLPDLVLLDIMMPEMDGFEVCRQFGDNYQTKDIPVIFLTAIGESENILKGFELGAVDFISKPFFEPELIARVKTHLTLTRMRKEKEEANIILEQKVNERTAQLRTLNKELNAEVKERKFIADELKKNNKELEKAKTKAEESNRLKTAFLNNVSHEIRTPMNGIIGFTQFLSMPDLTDNQRDEYIEVITTSTDKLLGIVDEIIYISKIQAGVEKTKNNTVNVNDLLLELGNYYKPVAEKKSLDILWYSELENGLATINTDFAKLKQTLTILIENAFKFTQKGKIEFGYKKSDGFIEFFVKDTGIGIDSKMHHKIFQNFRQVEETSTRDYGGLGLGLSISKAYVELLGGKIWIESEINKGATFYFTIPYRPVDDIK